MSIYNYWANPTRAHKAVPSSGIWFSRGKCSYAGMDKHQVAQRALGRRTFSPWFHTSCVSRSPLCSLSGTSSKTGGAGMTAPLSRKATAERKRKVRKQKVSRWNRSVGPTSQFHPRGSRMPFLSARFWCAISPGSGRLQKHIHNSQPAGQYFSTCLGHQSLPKTT